MAEFDVSLKSTLLSILLPIVVVLFVFLMFKKPLKTLQDKWFAYFFNRLISTMNKKLGGEKEQLFGPLRKLKGDNPDLTLVEIGAGGGANFNFYPRGTSIICVEPNPQAESYLQKNASLFPHVMLKEFVVAKGEDMAEVPDNYCDAAVCSFVLCSADDVDKLLKEVKRVLKPGGMFFCVEHIAAPRSTWSYSLQCFLNPVWCVCGQGCNLNRESWRNMEQAGFSNLEYRRFTTSSWMLPLKYLFTGIATK